MEDNLTRARARKAAAAWAIERATGQRQLDEAGTLITEAAAISVSKAQRNEQIAERLEAWLLGEADPDLATGCADDLAPALLESCPIRLIPSAEQSNASARASLDQSRADLWPCRLSGQIEDDQREAHLRADPGLAQLEPQSVASKPDLIAAMMGARLIEEGVGWVKVHGLPDARALFDLLSAANAIANGAARWRMAGVADLTAFRLSTGDPRFDPAAPVTINGFLYHPAKENDQ